MPLLDEANAIIDKLEAEAMRQKALHGSMFLPYQKPSPEKSGDDLAALDKETDQLAQRYHSLNDRFRRSTRDYPAQAPLYDKIDELEKLLEGKLEENREIGEGETDEEYALDQKLNEMQADDENEELDIEIVRNELEEMKRQHIEAEYARISEIEEVKTEALGYIQRLDSLLTPEQKSLRAEMRALEMQVQQKEDEKEQLEQDAGLQADRPVISIPSQSSLGKALIEIAIRDNDELELYQSKDSTLLFAVDEPVEIDFAKMRSEVKKLAEGLAALDFKPVRTARGIIYQCDEHPDNLQSFEQLQDLLWAATCHDRSLNDGLCQGHVKGKVFLPNYEDVLREGLDGESLPKSLRVSGNAIKPVLCDMLGKEGIIVPAVTQIV